MSTCSDPFRSPMPVPVKAFEYPRAFSADRLADAMSEDLKPEPETARPSPAVPLITESDVAAAHEKGRKKASEKPSSFSVSNSLKPSPQSALGSAKC